MYDDIFIFLKVVELGTYVKTAERLNTTQSTITRRIQSLEEKLKVALFTRNYRGNIELTSDGETLQQKFFTLYKNLDTQINETANQSEEIQGTLNIALPAVISRSVISPYVHEFTQKFPGVRLILRYISKPIDLTKDGFDLAVSAKMPLSQNSTVKILKKLALKFYATPEYINKYGKPDSFNDLIHHPCIGLLNEHGDPFIHYKVKDLKNNTEFVYNLEAQIYVNNIFQGFEIGRSGNFIICGWDAMFVNLLQNGSLVQILEDYVLDESPFYLIRSSGIRNRAEKVFAGFINDCFARL